MSRTRSQKFTFALLGGCICSLIFGIGAVAQLVYRPSAPQEENLKSFLRGHLGKPSLGGAQATRYSSAFVNLEDDGTQDIIVYLMGRNWCGSGGCTTLVLASEGDSFRLVTKITITRLPIRVLATKSNGWHDIAVRVQGGGIRHAYEAKLSFDGKTYPTNPSMPPARPLTEKAPGKIAIPSGSEGAALLPLDP